MDLAVWDVVLDADAVTALYNSGSQILPLTDSGNYDNSSNLVGYFRNKGADVWTNEVTVGQYGAEHWDNDYSTGIGSWSAHNTNTVTNDNGAVKIAYNSSGGGDNGAELSLKDDHDLNQNLVIGVSYQLTFDAKHTVVAPYVWRLGNGSDIQDISISSTTTEFQSYNFIFHNQTTVDCYFRLNGMGTGEIAWIKNISLKRYRSGTDTSGDAGSPIEALLTEGTTAGSDNQGFLLHDTTPISNGVRFHDNEYIDLLDISADNALTVEAWIYPTSFGDVVWGDTGNDNWVRINSATETAVKIGGNSTVTWNHGLTFTLNEWQHFAMVRASTGVMTIYRNGGAGGTPSSAQTGTATFKALGQKNSGDYWNGKLDEFRFYDRALSTTEILKNYNNGKASHS